MSLCSLLAARTVCCAAVLTSFYHGVADAHVMLDSPVGGEQLDGGFVFPIEWHPTVQHNTLNWDLWYSTSSSSGPWVPIVVDLPVSSPVAGTPYLYNWYVDNLDADNAWVRVRQDNTGDDYYDVSQTSFQIEAVLPGDFTGNKIVNDNDYQIWQDNFGTDSGVFFSQGDADFDDDVDGKDFIIWQQHQGANGSPALSAAIPEPSTLLLFIFSLLMIAARGR